MIKIFVSVAITQSTPLAARLESPWEMCKNELVRRRRYWFHKQGSGTERLFCARTSLGKSFPQ